MIEYLPAEINALKWMMFGEEDVLSLGLMFPCEGRHLMLALGPAYSKGSGDDGEWSVDKFWNSNWENITFPLKSVCLGK